MRQNVLGQALDVLGDREVPAVDQSVHLRRTSQRQRGPGRSADADGFVVPSLGHDGEDVGDERVTDLDGARALAHRKHLFGRQDGLEFRKLGQARVVPKHGGFVFRTWVPD